MALFAALVGLAAGGGLAARLFVGGAIGLSDQGDGTRLLCSLGLREGNPYNTPMTDYVYLTWYSHQWFGEACGALGSGEPYNSSQLWFLSVAKWLTPILQLPGGLDLRALGLVFCVVVAVLMAALAALLPGTGMARLAGVAGVMLVVADGTFAGYFLSAYSEPAALVGLLGLVVSILLFWRARRASWWSLLLVVGTCLLTITAKTQSASLLVTVIPLILLRPSFGSAVSSRLAQRRHVGARVRLHNRASAFVVSRWPALGCALLMLVVTGQYLGSQPHRFEEQNRYAAVFIEMLPHSPDPAQDLQRLGLDPAMVSSSGTPINAPGSAASTLGFVDFVQHTSPLDTTLIYLEQPWRLVGMGDRGVSGMAILRADYIFSYPPSAGHPPNTAECRVRPPVRLEVDLRCFPTIHHLGHRGLRCRVLETRVDATTRRASGGPRSRRSVPRAQRHGTVLGGDVDGRCFRPDQAHGPCELHDGTADRGDLLRDRRPAPPEHRWSAHLGGASADFSGFGHRHRAGDRAAIRVTLPVTSWLRRERSGVGADHVGVELRRVLDDPRLGLVVDPDHSEPSRVSPGPLEVVQQRPELVTADVRAGVDGVHDRGEVGTDVVDPLRVADLTVGVDRVGEGGAVLRDEQRQVRVRSGRADEQLGQASRVDQPAHLRPGA